MKIIISGCGSYLPEKILTNFDLAKLVDTNHDWIKSRTGIDKRHIAATGQLSSDLAVIAAERAIEDAGIDKSQIDLVIVATSTPDLTMPSTACIIHQKLNLQPCPAFDMQAVCAGFLYAIVTAYNYMIAGNYKNVLVIGTETMSRIVDWQDRATCILFGDGAGAFLLSSMESEEDRGVIGYRIMADGKYNDILNSNGGVSLNQIAGKLIMQGSEVYRHAVEKMSSVCLELLKDKGLIVDDIDFLVPHQANNRIINSIAQKINLPQNKIVETVNQHANCSAASIPLAFDFLKKQNILKKNDKILFSALGSGLTWGSMIVGW